MRSKPAPQKAAHHVQYHCDDSVRNVVFSTPVSSSTHRAERRQPLEAPCDLRWSIRGRYCERFHVRMVCDHPQPPGWMGVYRCRMVHDGTFHGIRRGRVALSVQGRECRLSPQLKSFLPLRHYPVYPGNPVVLTRYPG